MCAHCCIRIVFEVLWTASFNKVRSVCSFVDTARTSPEKKIRVSNTRSVFVVYPGEPFRQQAKKALIKSTRNKTNERPLRIYKIKYWQRINICIAREFPTCWHIRLRPSVLSRRSGGIPLGNPSDRRNAAKSMLIFSDVRRSNYPPRFSFLSPDMGWDESFAPKKMGDGREYLALRRACALVAVGTLLPLQWTDNSA